MLFVDNANEFGLQIASAVRFTHYSQRKVSAVIYQCFPDLLRDFSFQRTQIL